MGHVSWDELRDPREVWLLREQRVYGRDRGEHPSLSAGGARLPSTARFTGRRDFFNNFIWFAWPGLTLAVRPA